MSRAIHDPWGECLALLARAWFDRTRGQPASTISTIHSVLRTAQRLNDHSLLAQTYNALGNELSLQGETDSALGQYRRALEVVEHAQVGVYALPARRALLYASEMTT